MYVDSSWLSLDPIYLSLLHPHKLSDNFSDMDGFQDGGYHDHDHDVVCRGNWEAGGP